MHDAFCSSGKWDWKAFNKLQQDIYDTKIANASSSTAPPALNFGNGDDTMKTG